MHDPTHYRLTQKLVEYSSKLDDLICKVRRMGPHQLNVELLDELAVTVDELLLTLDEHRRAWGADELIDAVIADARGLHCGVRSVTLAPEEVADAAASVARGLGRVIDEDKRAA